jgi:N-acetylglucosaminyl-diphospho-decaprenol L-rhamnosyltransferase
MSSGVGSAVGVGVVIVHFGDPAPTVACVEAVRRDASACARRIVVVDNSGDLDTARCPGAALVRAPGNLGFGGGANEGVAALGPGPWQALVILNNDVEVRSGYLDAAVRAVGQAGVGASVGPLYLDHPDGTLWYAGGGVNLLTGTVWQARSRRAAKRERSVGFLSGAALAVAPEAWVAVGGFDAAYFLYNEDVDLSLRLLRAGWRLVFAPEMVAVHRLGFATGSAARSALYLEHMAATRLRPFRPLAYRLYLALLHSGYAITRAAWLRVAVGGDPGRVAAGALLRGHRRALARLLEAPLRP